ncbi:MAG: recombinase family protein, partial [Thermosynechococcaceae cyanobacterium]
MSCSLTNVMRAIAYLYYDPTWEPRPDPAAWGWKLDQIYEDIDPRRSQLQTLLRQVTQSPPDYVILRRLEELGTTVTAVTQCLTQFQSLGISVVALEQPHPTNQPTCAASTLNQSPTNPDPLPAGLNLELLTLLQAIRQQQHRRQICQGHARNRLQGLPPPGRAPYGYRRGRDRYVIDRSVTPVLRDFFDQFLLYGSLRGAVRYIGQKHGKKVSVSTGRRWLTNPVYRGNLAYRNQDTLPGTHPPILTPEEAAQIDRLLRRNRNLAPRAASAPRSLAGLVFCQQCQSP